MFRVSLRLVLDVRYTIHMHKFMCFVVLSILSCGSSMVCLVFAILFIYAHSCSFSCVITYGGEKIVSSRIA